MTRRRASLTLALSIAAVVSLAALDRPSAGRAASAALVRVNTSGYSADAPKRVVVLTHSAGARGAAWALRSTSGHLVAHGMLRADIGRWNATWRHAWAIDLTRVRRPGRYQLALSGSLAHTPDSPLRVVARRSLYSQMLANSLRYFQAQRDGPLVIAGSLRRRPAHLEDAAAAIYSPPPLATNGSLDGALVPDICCVDVSGGWADAGDYLKFVETTSYTEAMLLVAVRDYPRAMTGASSGYAAETAFGMDWLTRMWQPASGTLLNQVGLGDGSARITGDHDRWRLPEADDAAPAARGPHSAVWWLAHRPVFAAGPAGSPLSPNLAGRMAGDFALCWQVWHLQDPDRAQACIHAAQRVLAQANLDWTGPLVTTYPFAYYEERSWHEDVEFGAAEIALALQAGAVHTPGLAHNDPSFYLTLAAQQASDYIESNQADGDALSVYDMSPLAHRDLARALAAAPAAPTNGYAVSRVDLVGDLHDQLAAGARMAATDPFGLTAGYTSGADAAPRALGYALTELWYRDLGGGPRYADLARRQIDWTLGANAWGTSFIVGAGASAHCIHHQVANLAGSRSGNGSRQLLGAVIAGPAAPAQFADTGTPDGSRPCVHSLAQSLDGHGAPFVDSVGAWASTEPANDYVAPTAVLFAALAS